MPWTDTLAKKSEFMTFFKGAQEKNAAVKKVVTRYMLLETLQGHTTPVPAPLQCKDKNDRTAECTLSFFRSESKDLLGTNCKAAMGQINDQIKPNTRAAEDFQKARTLMEENGYDMGSLYSKLVTTQTKLSQMIEKLYTQYPKDEMNKKAQESEEQGGRDKFEFELKNVRDRKAAAATALEGTIKNKKFHLYTNVRIGNESGPVLVISDTGSDPCNTYNQGKHLQGTIVEKGTNKLTRNKYFKFKGGPSLKEMFDALKETGWNMKNLKRPEDLEKVT